MELAPASGQAVYQPWQAGKLSQGKAGSESGCSRFEPERTSGGLHRPDSRRHGTATRFIGGGKQLHGFRKRLLGKVAVNRSKTGLIAEGEQDNQHLWQKIRHLDENVAHQVSHRIVEFARQQGASVIVFEHLRNFQPVKGRYSRKANEKRSYWLRGKILHYTRYKAWEAGEGLITSRVSPYNTSRECARCHAMVARYRNQNRNKEKPQAANAS